MLLRTLRLIRRQIVMALVLFIALVSGVTSAESLRACIGASLDRILTSEARREGPRVYIKAEDKVRDFDSITELKMMTYNVLNLMRKKGKFMTDPATGKVSQILPEIAKTSEHFEQQANIILKADSDIVALQEVEDIQSLNSFNTLVLGNTYKSILIPGNDGRGIDVGFLVKKDLPFDIEVLSHREILNSNGGKVFSRDVPVLHFRKKGADEKAHPFMTIVGVHLKSKRDRPGDPESKMKRQEEVDALVEIISDQQRQYGDKHLILTMGDFNGDLRKDDVLEKIRQGFADTLSLMQGRLSPAEASEFEKNRVTQSFFPDGRPTQYSQFDGLCIANKAVCDGLMKSSEVISYESSSGGKKPLPTSYAEREQDPSDHRPVSAVLDFTKILSSKK